MSNYNRYTRTNGQKQTYLDELAFSKGDDFASKNTDEETVEKVNDSLRVVITEKDSTDPLRRDVIKKKVVLARWDI